jgi:predicted AlkP superfamily phosphohydrolase/phosphomutase
MLLGFDALDPATALSMAEEGRLPAFRGMLESSARCQVRNPYGLFVGTLWPSFFTACSPVRTGFHCWEEIVAGTYQWRMTTADAIEGTPFWETLSQAGRRVAVLDVPHSKAGRPLNGVQVSEWGCHDRHFGFRTYPAAQVEEIIDTVGLHPVLTTDPFAVREFAPDDYVHRAGDLRTHQEEARLLDGLLAGADGKLRLSAGILAQGSWDLFLSVFGESHSIGHQCWHVRDQRHPRHDASQRTRLGDPVARVYQRLDANLAAHLAHADEETTVLVLLSHGMGPHYDGTHLLAEMLRRLDRVYRGDRMRPRTGRALEAMWQRLPHRLRVALAGRSAAALRRRLRGAPEPEARGWESEDERRQQAFFLSPNNYVVGGVRINVVGRESEGRVTPGAEFDEVCRRLRADLLDVINVDTGEPVVRRVERSDHHYRRRPLDALPDVFIEWNQDSPIETVWSPRFGVVHGRYTHWRTGDHRAGGLLLARGPGIIAGAELPVMDIMDLAPSVAARLGVALPDVDGVPVDWLASATAEVRS